MIINNFSPTKNYNMCQTSTFKGNDNPLQKAFDWCGNQCNVSPNGSLTRSMFFMVGLVFMLGGRFFKGRSKDEKREVITRDLPAVAISAYGAHLLNSAMAYCVSKSTGVPIIQFNDSSKSIARSSFVSQKQITDWYSGFKSLDNPVINFANTLNKHGGDIPTAMKKLGLEKEFKKVVGNKKSSEEILKTLKTANSSKNKAFKELENGLKNIKDDNALLKFAKNSQAGVKLGGIALTAAFLGGFLPWLNIQITRKKYQHKEENNVKLGK